MANDHYFSAKPDSDFVLKKIEATLAGQRHHLTTSGGIFSPNRIDDGTNALLAEVSPPPKEGNLLDIGCGWGPLALTQALLSPLATIWAVDVNERALNVVRMNAEQLGLPNLVAARPEEIPADLRFDAIWSNPPIRVGKKELHALMEQWIPRLKEESAAWLVVQRNLGADSLHRWLEATFTEHREISRIATHKGYRIIKITR